MAMRTTVLVLEDDDSIRQLLAATLRAEGHQIEEATNVRDGRTLASNRPIDVYLVDLGLPDGDGVEFIRWLRGWTQRPVIVLSARVHEAHKVVALDAGADDFVSKPFSVAELHARMRVALRHAARTAMGGSTRLMLGELCVDLDARSVQRGDERIRLTGTQWRLLEALARHAGRVVTSAALLREVWGPGHDEQLHYLRIYVRQLRQKLEADPTNPVYLLNETGVGYRLVSR
ncbi:response regulator [Aquincola tertiaricarbonis]|uniref:Response regulator n=1 Tax=Aquincola tertiaricarbonis TaxID=391953 RepID=A0ABY4RYS2_AQUTE|nr:response regulator [Aquincola tertiaricarbonis]URI05941.1 response regulator [Aquincola tertiaricarbonis]